MTLTVLGLVAGLVLLYLGAEALVRGASALGLKLGLTPLVIGLTIVAFGTSAPELLVSVQAGLSDQGPMAIGNVVGSNIANIALILGVAALVRPLDVKAQVVQLESPLLIGVSVVLVALLWNGVIGRIEGAALFTGIVVYTVFSVRMAARERQVEVAREYEAALPDASRPLWQ